MHGMEMKAWVFEMVVLRLKFWLYLVILEARYVFNSDKIKYIYTIILLLCFWHHIFRKNTIV